MKLFSAKKKNKSSSQTLKTLELKVGELTSPEEVGKGIITLDPEVMKTLGLNENDVVEIKGNKKTCAIVKSCRPEDMNLNIVRMDGLTRFNAGLSVGDTIKIKSIRKIKVKDAKKVILEPYKDNVVIHFLPEVVSKSLVGLCVHEGCVITPSSKTKTSNFLREFFGSEWSELFSETELLVKKTIPKGYVRITNETELELLGKKIHGDTGIPENRVIEVKKMPNLKGMIEVKSLKEMRKLSNYFLINKYENSKQVIYFTDKYYLKLPKKKRR